MKTLLYFYKSFGTKGLLIAAITILFAGSLVVPGALAQDSQAERQKIVQQVAAKWIQNGLEQYERGLFEASVQSFLRAKDYEDHMSADQKQRLNELLNQASAAVSESQRIDSSIKTAGDLLNQKRNAEAKTVLESIQDSQFLSEQQRAVVEEYMVRVSAGDSPMQAQMAQLYNQSVDYYNAGELENARAGFLEVSRSGLAVAPAGNRAEDYLAKIDAKLLEPKTAESPAVISEPVAAVEESYITYPEPEPAANTYSEPTPQLQPSTASYQPVQVDLSSSISESADSSYIEAIQKRNNILRSHTKAVVNDTLAKAKSLQQQNEFEQAIKSVDYAQNIVNKNKLQLGEELFGQYTLQLQQQRDEIIDAQKAREIQLAEQKRTEAAQEQEQIRSRMAADRKKRIDDLYNNAVAYQKQQRYEESLGQLQSLLAIDPLNNHALILKDTLEDTVSYRKQLEVQKEKQLQKTELMLETRKTAVPYAKEMTHPKDWKQIIARRSPDQVIGRDPATARVYEQFEQLVDLSDIDKDTPFGEAIAIIRNSVEPSLKIVVMWRDLYDNADIDQTTPVNMDPISAIKLSSSLKLLLESVSGGFARLGYVVENGIITIATEESLPSELITLVYDVTDLVQMPARYRVQVSGGGGGGGGGVSDVGGGFQDQGQDEDLSSDEMETQAQERIDALILLVQDTIAPDSWFFAGGEGTITSYSYKLLSVRQTAEVHNSINNLLAELRKAHGYQVAIEARFIVVQENFLEEIGLDIDFYFRPGGKWGEIAFGQDSTSIAASAGSGVTGTFGGITSPTILGGDGITAGKIGGGYGSFLDDLEVSFLLTATQAHRDATVVTAPKATVLSGESASFRLEKYLYYAGNIEVESTEAGDQARGTFTVNYEDRSVTSGTILNITPTITPDKKYVLLNIDTQLNDFLGFRQQTIDIPLFGDAPGQGISYQLEFPETETSQIRTRVSVPDRGTLLLGGQKLGAEIKKESGVPVLSKIPVLGRAFRNTSEVKDHKILLILVKPTIILQQEAESDAIASFEKGDF